MSAEKKAEFSEEDEPETQDDVYFQKLRALNESFLKWIQDYMSQNPHYVFTPVCKEYIQYMDSIDSQFRGKRKRGRPKRKVTSPLVKVNDKVVNNDSESQPSSSQESQNSPRADFTTSTPAASTSNSGMHNFGSEVKRCKSESTPKTSSIGPDFFSATKSSLSSIAEAKPNEEAVAENEDEEYQPPKPSTTIIEENDCVYSKRCKLFYKKESKFVDKGIGVLYVKPQEDNKYQLLIRADTAVGHILLNIQLHPSLPLKLSKKGILLTCVPNPPIADKVEDRNSLVTFFVRVKNEDDAKDLLDNLSEYSSKVKKC